MSYYAGCCTEPQLYYYASYRTDPQLLCDYVAVIRLNQNSCVTVSYSIIILNHNLSVVTLSHNKLRNCLRHYMDDNRCVNGLLLVIILAHSSSLTVTASHYNEQEILCDSHGQWYSLK